MAIYLELPVYKTSYELYLTFVTLRRKLPREKSPLIARARQLVVEIEIRTRILRDIKALSVRQSTMLFDLSESVSRQLVNWQRSVSRQTKISDAVVSSPADGRPESGGSRSVGVRHTANPMKQDDPTYSTEETT